MRKSFLLALILIAAAAVSCNGSSSDNKTEANEDLTPKPGTYKFVASELKGVWNEGDCIYVHGSLGSRSQTVTLKRTDISSDGKTATAELGDVTELLLEPDGLYAEWPDIVAKHPFGVVSTKTTFTNCDTLLTLAYLKDDTFTFVDMCAELLFTVDGDYECFAISSADKSYINVIGLSAVYTSLTKEFTKTMADGGPFKYGTVQPGKQVRIILPGGLSLMKGSRIYFGKGNAWPAVYEISDRLSISTGERKDLGNISSSVTSYEGPAPRMPEKGKVTKYDVAFNELSGICLSSDGTFLWGMGDDGSIARLSLEGKLLDEDWIGCDLEAVTIDPRNGDLIVGIEDCYDPEGTKKEDYIYSYNGIGRIAAPGFSAVEGLFRIPAANKYNNAGIEGITYYKDGLVYAGAQANSHLFLCDIDQQKVVSDIKLREVFPQITEIADLCYDPLTDWLWVIDSESKKFFALTGDASEMLGFYSLGNIDNPEAIFVDHQHSCIWVGDDYGEVSHLFRIDFTGLDDAIIAGE